MPDRDAFFQRRARLFYNDRTVREQGDIDRIIIALCEDPAQDDILKLSLPFAPRNPTLYRDGTYFVVYDEENNWTLSIWDIGYDRGDSEIVVPDV